MFAAGGVSREYFIAVETVEWQYADPAYNFCYGRNYSFDENAIVRSAPAASVPLPTPTSSRALPHPFSHRTDVMSCSLCVHVTREHSKHSATPRPSEHRPHHPRFVPANPGLCSFQVNAALGNKFFKSQYTAYTDATFQTRKVGASPSDLASCSHRTAHTCHPIAPLPPRCLSQPGSCGICCPVQARPASEEHLGILGPLIRATVRP